jgi:hypothetical protein
MTGVVIDSGSGGATVATDTISGTDHQLVKLEYGAAGAATQVSPAAPLPTTLATVGAITAQLALTDETLLVRQSTDVLLDLARKHITGQRTFFFFGFHRALGTAWEDVTPTTGDIPRPVAAAKVAISSSHAADTSAGLGCRSVEIHGLSALGADQDEVIATSGVTEVESTLDYVRVNKMHSETVGTYGGSHQGDIQCRVTSAGAKTGDVLGTMVGYETTAGTSVQYGAGEMGAGHWSVPLGKVAYLTGGSINVNTNAAKTADILLYERDDLLDATVPFIPRRLIFSANQVQGFFPFKFASYKKMKALTDIWFRAKASNSGTFVEVSLEFFLVDENASGA